MANLRHLGSKLKSVSFVLGETRTIHGCQAPSGDTQVLTVGACGLRSSPTVLHCTSWPSQDMSSPYSPLRQLSSLRQTNSFLYSKSFYIFIVLTPPLGIEAQQLV